MNNRLEWRVPARVTPGRAPRVLAILGAVLGALLVGGSGAFGYWLSTSGAIPSGAAAATMPTGLPPTASTTPSANSTTVTLTFVPAAIPGTSTTIPAGNYTVKRYPADGPSAVATAVSCSGTSPITCTTLSEVPDGTWVYTTTPTYGQHWLGGESARSAEVTVDTTPPTIAAPTVPGYATIKVPISLGSLTDGGSGPDDTSITLWREQSTLSGNSCSSPFGALTQIFLVEGSDDTVSSGACYRYQQRATDLAGNVGISQWSGTVKVDSSAPSAPTLGFSGLSNAYWPGTGTIVFFKGGGVGSFTITPTSTDPETGIAGYTYPNLGGGWTNTAGTYSFTTAALTANESITATNNAGLSTPTSFTAQADTAAPTGGALIVNGFAATSSGSTSTLSTGTTLILNSRTDFTETPSTTQSGLASSTLTTQTAALTNNTCGAFGTPTTITGNPSQTVAPGYCYLFTLTGTDLVGNTTTLTSTVKVDLSAPSAPTLGFSGLSNAYWPGTGTIVFFKGGGVGSFTITPTSTDPETGIAGYTYPNLGGGWTNTAGTYSFTTAALTANESITATNNAGLSTPTSFTAQADTAAPTGGALIVNGFAATSSGSNKHPEHRHHPDPELPHRLHRDPLDHTIRARMSTLTTQTAALTNNTCGAFGTPTTITGNPSQTVAPGSCYLYTLTGTDLVGNTTTLTTTVKVAVDATAPTITAVTLDNGGATVGRIERDDVITITFSERMRVSSLCSAWTNDNADQDLVKNDNVSITVQDGGTSGETTSPPWPAPSARSTSGAWTWGQLDS